MNEAQTRNDRYEVLGSWSIKCRGGLPAGHLSARKHLLPPVRPAGCLVYSFGVELFKSAIKLRGFGDPSVPAALGPHRGPKIFFHSQPSAKFPSPFGHPKTLTNSPVLKRPAGPKYKQIVRPLGFACVQGRCYDDLLLTCSSREGRSRNGPAHRFGQATAYLRVP